MHIKLQMLQYCFLILLWSCLGDKDEEKKTVTNKKGTRKEKDKGDDNSNNGNGGDNNGNGGNNSGDSINQLQDPLYEDFWHLKNTGQFLLGTISQGTAGADINVEKVHAAGITGAGIKIAVSDTGLATDHEDFSGRLLENQHRDYSLTDSTSYEGDPNPDPSNTDGDHGTSVTGLIVAAGNNKIGGRGVAYGASAAGFKYIAHQDLARKIHQYNGNFDIFNYSYGYPACRFIPTESAVVDQIKNGVNSLRDGKGAIYVKAAGNDFKGIWGDCGGLAALLGAATEYYGNTNRDGYKTLPYLIIVGSLSAYGISSGFSASGSSLWISAPGGGSAKGRGLFGTEPNIITTDRPGCDKGDSKTGALGFNGDAHPKNPHCDYHSDFKGTSAAAPIVSGVVALMLEANGNLSWRDVKHILAKTAKRLDPTAGPTEHSYLGVPSGHIYEQGWVRNSAGYYFHNWYGFGGIDAYKAVEAATNYTTDLGELVVTDWFDHSGDNSLNLDIPDDSSVGATHTLNVTEDLIIEAVQIKMHLNHTRFNDLGVELTSHSGTKSILLNVRPRIPYPEITDSNILLSNAFYGENSQGNWILKIIDARPDEIGRLESWSINFFARRPDSNQDSIRSKNGN